MAINDVERKRREAIEYVARRISDMTGIFYDVIVKELEKKLDVKGGQIVVDSEFVKKLNRIIDDTIASVQKSPQFGGVIAGFIKRLDSVSGEITKFQRTENKIDVPAYQAAKRVVIDEVIEQFLNRGLNQHFAQPLRDLIYRNATGRGLSMTQARDLVKEYIGSGKDKSGKLHSYLEQTTQQAVDSYTGMINVKLMETFDYNALLMTGTLIDNSSPQCIYALDDLGGTIRREDWPKVKSKATKKAPLIKGTTFDNLPIMLLHWGCRHSFYPMII